MLAQTESSVLAEKSLAPQGSGAILTSGFAATGVSAAYGAIVGGLSSADVDGAITGALAGAGLSSVGYGTTYAMNRLYVPAALVGGLGLASLILAFYRYRKRKGA